ncbi:MAG: hypothetical protein L7W43_11515 [Rubripirellula sp.]|nr:hypothetical protein [Rubripirellula sp.]
MPPDPRMPAIAALALVHATEHPAQMYQLPKSSILAPQKRVFPLERYPQSITKITNIAHNQNNVQAD